MRRRWLLNRASCLACFSPRTPRADRIHVAKSTRCSRRVCAANILKVARPARIHTAHHPRARRCKMFQKDLLKDRAIFLSGGGSGLGRSMALHFASLGAKMFIIGRPEELLNETCALITKPGGSAAYAACDVRDFAAVEAAADRADAAFGRIDTVVNNAAGNFMARTEK